MTKPPESSSDSTQFFFELTPDRVLESVEAAGLRTTGRCQALNSFENRVYEVELELDEDLPPPTTAAERTERLLASRRVIKFYRPGRWTLEQIQAEHEFLLDLVGAEVPAVPPVKFPDGSTIQTLEKAPIHYALFRKVGGRSPDELTPDQLRQMGRLLARIHTVGARKPGESRIRLDAETYGWKNLDFLRDEGFIPMDFERRYTEIAETILAIAEDEGFHDLPVQRIHGDLHLGNVLWNGERAFFVDFDDMVRGPVVQDFWLLIPGEGEEAARNWKNLLEGYEEMRPFDHASLRYVELLRALRFIHYTAWVARRWKDPAFPLAFPQFGSHQYWNEQTEDLDRQLQKLETIFGASFQPDS